MLHRLNSTPPNSLPGVCAARCRAEQSKYLSKRSPSGVPSPYSRIARVHVFRLAPYVQNWNAEWM